MKINWLGTAAVALVIGTGSAFAQQMDQPQRRDEGARSALPSRGAERPAAREERPAGAMRDAAQGAATEPRRSESMPQREQAQQQQPRDSREPARQTEERTGHGERSTVGAAQQDQDRRGNRDRNQAAEQKRSPGREDQRKAEQQKPDTRGHDTIGNATSNKQQQGQDHLRRGEGQATGTAQQNDQQRKGRAAEQKGSDTGRSAEQKNQPTGRESGREGNSKQTAQQPARNQAGQTENQSQTDQGRGRNAAGQTEQREKTGQAQNQSTERNGTSSAAAKVSNEQRTQVVDRLRRDRDIDRARSDINIHVNIGERLPDRVRPRPLPPDIVSIAPEYRGYEYTVVGDEITIVNPGTREVVDVLPERGFTAESGSHYKGRVVLSTEQRDILRREVSSSATVGSTASSGGDLTCLSLRPVPEDLARSNPQLSSYRYLAVGSEIVLVDPREHRVVDVIQ